MAFPVDSYTPDAVTHVVTIVDQDDDNTPVFHYEARIRLDGVTQGVDDALLSQVTDAVAAYGQSVVGTGNYATRVRYEFEGSRSVTATVGA